MSTESSSNGIGFASILFFIFLVMKLMHYIDWSWWWVTAPLWLPITVILGILGVCGAVALIVMLVAAVIAKVCDK